MNPKQFNQIQNHLELEKYILLHSDYTFIFHPMNPHLLKIEVAAHRLGLSNSAVTHLEKHDPLFPRAVKHHHKYYFTEEFNQFMVKHGDHLKNWLAHLQTPLPMNPSYQNRLVDTWIMLRNRIK